MTEKRFTIDEEKIKDNHINYIQVLQSLLSKEKLGLTERFYIDNSGDLWDRQSNDLLMQNFGYCEAIYVNAILDLLNRLNDENQQLRNFIMDLQSVVQFDVDNGINAYHTKTLLEDLTNALKVIMNDRE